MDPDDNTWILMIYSDIGSDIDNSDFDTSTSSGEENDDDLFTPQRQQGHSSRISLRGEPT